MPAVPAAIMAGSAIYGAYQSRKAAHEAMQLSPVEQQAQSNSQRLATLTAGQGRQMFDRAMPAVGNTLNYYQTLLNGSKAARYAATSPEAESTSSAYEGANQAIGRSYIRGGQKDQALAENARARAGDIARLTTGVRPMAAQGTMGVAGQLLPAGAQAYGTSAGINEGLAGGGFRNRQLGQEAGANAGQNWGQLFARLLSIYGNKGIGGRSGMGYATGGNGQNYQPGWDAGFG